MSVNSIGHSGNIKSLHTTPATSHVKVQQQSAQATSTAKLDSAYFSEKAKELAAQQAGKSAQEEAGESAATRLSEGE
jgi:hypothetical protein